MSKELERKDAENSKIDWNEHASYWNEFNDAKIYTGKVVETLKGILDLKDLNVIDFGCGTGLLTDHMMKEARHIVAIDSADKMIEVLESKNYENVTAIHGELSESLIENQEVLQQKFDAIIAVSVCAFVPNYEEVLSHVKSLLKPTGLFIQLDWKQNKPVSDFGFTEEMIRKSYENIGLKVDSVSIPFFFQEFEEKMDVIMGIGKL